MMVEGLVKWGVPTDGTQCSFAHSQVFVALKAAPRRALGHGHGEGGVARHLVSKRVTRVSRRQWLSFPEGPSTQIGGFQGPKTIQGMDFGT